MGQFNDPPPWLITEFFLHLNSLLASFFDMRNIAVGLNDLLCRLSRVAFVRAQVLHGSLRWKTDAVLKDSIDLRNIMPIGTCYD